MMTKSLSSHGITVLYQGPDDHTPMPAIFYFILSAKDSLCLDPFNQPVNTWKNFPLRVFSLTLPCHDENFEADVGIERWKKSWDDGIDPLSPFFELVANVIEDLIERKWIDPTKLAVSGLSRGGFIAIHVAAKVPQISHILAFAPLTTLQTIEEFSPIKEDIAHLDLVHLKDKLHHQTHRYYIGNRDIRVSTESCFNYVKALTDEMYYQQVRHLPVELLIKPSIGRYGHGTNSATFEEGALWLAKSLLQLSS